MSELSATTQCLMCQKVFAFDIGKGVPDYGTYCPRCEAKINKAIAARIHHFTGRTRGGWPIHDSQRG